MIKFFRHIRKSLLMENKTGKYFKYAIGEIVLVVIGILIALQINNWNENKKFRIKEITMLNELHLEFKANKEKLLINTREHEKRYQSTQKAIELLPIDLKKTNLDSLSSYINSSIGFWTFEPSQGTINSLINSSNLDLITNDELRRTLLSWHSIFSDYNEDELKANIICLTFFFPLLKSILTGILILVIAELILRCYNPWNLKIGLLLGYIF